MRGGIAGILAILVNAYALGKMHGVPAPADIGAGCAG